MKIKIQSKKLKITLVLPNIILKWKFVIKRLTNNYTENLWIKNLYKILKKYIKEYGHFTLLEVENVIDSYKVVIKI